MQQDADDHVMQQNADKHVPFGEGVDPGSRPTSARTKSLGAPGRRAESGSVDGDIWHDLKRAALRLFSCSQKNRLEEELRQLESAPPSA